jgi:2-oxo-4-hydroxy-4-carboxy-5-ureidoimidazoline decarboxylase
MPTVDEFNRLPGDAVRQELRACCSSCRWIDAVAGGRPYDSEAALLAASDAAVAGMTEAELGEALAGHPRIGDRRVAEAGQGSWSGQEQAGVRDAEASLRQSLDEGNAEYERRFGHIYLACATGRSAAELLAFLRERLGNDTEMEWSVVASELAKINQIRLRKLLGTGR